MTTALLLTALEFAVTAGKAVLRETFERPFVVAGLCLAAGGLGWAFDFRTFWEAAWWVLPAGLSLWFGYGGPKLIAN